MLTSFLLHQLIEKSFHKKKTIENPTKNSLNFSVRTNSLTRASEKNFTDSVFFFFRQNHNGGLFFRRRHCVIPLQLAATAASGISGAQVRGNRGVLPPHYLVVCWGLRELFVLFRFSMLFDDLGVYGMEGIRCWIW